MSSDKWTARLVLTTAGALALISLACFVYPMYVIRPFRHQGVGELAAALMVKQVGPWLSVFCAVACLGLIIVSRRQIRTWVLRSAAILAIIAAGLGAYLTRVNVYELMFHPVDDPRFESARKAKIDANDMVIAVNEGGVARAYPIRAMGYHHIVNDVVNGEPIVSTY